MATELTIKVPNRAGQLAAISTALGDAQVNIAALAGSAVGSKGVIHVVASDRKLLEVRLADKPGTLARVATRLGKGRVSVDSAYMIGVGKGSRTIGFGVKDSRKANKALGR